MNDVTITLNIKTVLIIVACLTIGFVLGLIFGGGSISYDPVTPPVTTTPAEFDPVFAIIAGVVGVAVVVLVGGFVLLQQH